MLRGMMQPPLAITALLVLLCGCTTTRPNRPTDLAPILQRCASDEFRQVLAAPETYRAQVLIAEVITNQFGRPSLHRFGYRGDARKRGCSTRITPEVTGARDE